MFLERYRERLKAREMGGLIRRPPALGLREGKYVYCEGKRLLNFASNDYLGLAMEAELSQKVAENFIKYGTSSSSSRLVAGNYEIISRAEEAYARYFGYETALFFPSGYQANLAVISTLFEKGDTLVFDKHLHASSIRGIVLSGATFKGYRHNSLSHLRRRLEENAQGNVAVLTESLFSIDGDLLDVAGFARLKEEFGFFSVIDEAHAFGVLGPKGKGLAQGLADVAVGTFGKALGFFGAFVLLSRGLKDYLFNYASPLIYSTALPAAHAASALDILDFLERGEERRLALKKVSSRMREGLLSRGLKVKGEAHILSLVIGDEKKTVSVAQRLFAEGIFVFAVRYPTVPSGEAQIRLSMTALHEGRDVEVFLSALDRVLKDRR